ncbi:unnamed protein product, partial [Symbiodinium necroappetens]
GSGGAAATLILNLNEKRSAAATLIVNLNGGAAVTLILNLIAGLPFYLQSASSRLRVRGLIVSPIQQFEFQLSSVPVNARQKSVQHPVLQVAGFLFRLYSGPETPGFGASVSPLQRASSRSEAPPFHLYSIRVAAQQRASGCETKERTASGEPKREEAAADLCQTAADMDHRLPAKLGPFRIVPSMNCLESKNKIHLPSLPPIPAALRALKPIEHHLLAMARISQVVLDKLVWGGPRGQWGRMYAVLMQDPCICDLLEGAVLEEDGTVSVQGADGMTTSSARLEHLRRALQELQTQH